jgi:hydroxyethylthiazole kinase-like sugar kinase family protein
MSSQPSLKESLVTKLTDKVVTEDTAPTLTVGDKTYVVADLSNEVKEMLSLHEQAMQMAIGAKRQAVIHDLAVSNIASLIERKLAETDE